MVSLKETTRMKWFNKCYSNSTSHPAFRYDTLNVTDLINMQSKTDQFFVKCHPPSWYSYAIAHHNMNKNRPLNPSDFELHPTSKLNICKTILFICYRWTLKYVIDRLKSQTYLGRITSTRFPLLCIALLRLRTKSPNFPHSVIGFSSVHICVICNPYLNIPNHRKPVSF